MFVLLLAIFILILWVELPTLIRKKLYPEILVFMGFYICGVTLAIISFYNLPLFNPFEAIASILAKY